MVVLHVTDIRGVHSKVAWDEGKREENDRDNCQHHNGFAVILLVDLETLLCAIRKFCALGVKATKLPHDIVEAVKTGFQQFVLEWKHANPRQNLVLIRKVVKDFQVVVDEIGLLVLNEYKTLQFLLEIGEIAKQAFPKVTIDLKLLWGCQPVPSNQSLRIIT